MSKRYSMEEMNTESGGCLLYEPTLDIKVGKIKASIWLWVALALLLVSNVLFFTSFVTNSWGIIQTPHGNDTWHFGLWQCCRESDGLCLGTRFTTSYSATRAFAVLTLISNILSFAWMVGYTLEKIIDYDPCAIGSYVTLIFSSAVFGLITVSVFGSRWAMEFKNEFNGISPQLSFSFIFAAWLIPLNVCAGICALLDLHTTLLRLDKDYVDGVFPMEHLNPDADDEDYGFKRKKKKVPTATLR